MDSLASKGQRIRSLIELSVQMNFIDTPIVSRISLNNIILITNNDAKIPSQVPPPSLFPRTVYRF